MAAAAVLANALMDIDPRYPKVSAEARTALGTVKGELMAEAPKGAEPDPIEAELAAKALDLLDHDVAAA